MFLMLCFGFLHFFSVDGPVPLPNMPHQIMNRMQVSQGTSCMFHMIFSDSDYFLRVNKHVATERHSPEFYSLAIISDKLAKQKSKRYKEIK